MYKKLVVIILTMGLVSRMSAYVSSGVSWQINKPGTPPKNIIVLGDVHEEHETGPLHAKYIKNILENLKSAPQKTAVILEDYWWKPWEVNEDVDQDMTLDCINHYAALCNYSDGNVRFTKADMRGQRMNAVSFLPDFDIIKNALVQWRPVLSGVETFSEVDAHLSEDDWNDLDSFLDILESHDPYLAGITKAHVYKDIDESIERILLLKAVTNNKIIQQKIQILENKYQELKTLLKQCANEEQFISIYGNLLYHIRSFNTLSNVLTAYLGPIEYAIAELGFIIAIMSVYNEADNIIVYVGDDHAAVLHRCIDIVATENGGGRNKFFVGLSYDPDSHTLTDEDPVALLQQQLSELFQGVLGII